MHQDGKDIVYVLYQKSISHVELWLWNPDTKIATKGLLSSYTPAGLKMLPYNFGFSFVDNGRIKVKRFSRRSPKSIDIYEPIYNIGEIEWVDEDNFYLSAKKDGHFGVFQVDSHGIIQNILEEKHKDCMYPQKVGQDLFYIERIIKEGVYKRDYTSYKVLMTDYPQKHNKKYFNDDLNSIENAEDYFKYLSKQEKMGDKKVKHIPAECLVDFRSCPIAFLKMVSDEEGFFLEHPTVADRQDKMLTFDYYHLKKTGGTWKCEQIFDFSVPTFLLLDARNDRVYESILPLLPRFKDGTVFFVDCSHSKDLQLALFSYKLSDGQIRQKTASCPGTFSFSPVFVGNKAFCGGSISVKDESLPMMWINDEGSVCIDLPAISLD